MECFICNEKDEKCTNLLGQNICRQCMKSISSIDAQNIFYNYYKYRIKALYKIYTTTI